MIKRIQSNIFPTIIALTALSVSGSAAFYSVSGLSKLFAGASTQVIIMAGSLEFAKLVVASLLYQYWDTINKWLRTYLAVACFVLMIITSGGIYGFLSGAYQSTANESELLDKFKDHIADDYMKNFDNYYKSAFTYKALNRLIQGSAADMTKKAMVDLYAQGILPQIQIHDELCLSVKNDKEGDIVKQTMEKAIQLKVPNKVNYKQGPNWGSIK
jgi:hypothetical protein